MAAFLVLGYLRGVYGLCILSLKKAVLAFLVENVFNKSLGSCRSPHLARRFTAFCSNGSLESSGLATIARIDTATPILMHGMGRVTAIFIMVGNASPCQGFWSSCTASLANTTPPGFVQCLLGQDGTIKLSKQAGLEAPGLRFA